MMATTARVFGRVSVVIPVHNQRRYVTEAVRSACEQDPAPSEVLVVDDGSTDGSADEVRNLVGPIKVIRLSHSGRSAARNAGIREATGEFVAFLDSDDLWLPGKLARQLALFERFPDVAMIAGHVWSVDGEGTHLPDSTADCRGILDSVARDDFSFEALVRHSGIFTSTLVARRRALVDVGMFDESLAANEDWDVELRIARRWAYSLVPWPPVAQYRVHGGGTSGEEMARGSLGLVRRHLDAEPPLSPRARALLLVHAARAHRALLEQADARRTVVASLRAAPLAALGAGAVRLGIGSLLPASLAGELRAKRQDARRGSR